MSTEFLSVAKAALVDLPAQKYPPASLSSILARASGSQKNSFISTKQDRSSANDCKSKLASLDLESEA